MSGHIGFVESELQSGVETKRDGVQQTTDGIELLASPRRPSRHRARPRRRPRRRIVNGRTAGALATPIEWSGPNHRRLRRRAAKAKVPYAACGTRADCSLFSRLFRAAVVSSHHPSCCHRRRGSSCASWRQLLGFRKKKTGVLTPRMIFEYARVGAGFIVSLQSEGVLAFWTQFYWRRRNFTERGRVLLEVVGTGDAFFFFDFRWIGSARPSSLFVLLWRRCGDAFVSRQQIQMRKRQQQNKIESKTLSEPSPDGDCRPARRRPGTVQLVGRWRRREASGGRAIFPSVTAVWTFAFACDLGGFHSNFSWLSSRSVFLVRSKASVFVSCVCGVVANETTDTSRQAQIESSTSKITKQITVFGSQIFEDYFLTICWCRSATGAANWRRADGDDGENENEPSHVDVDDGMQLLARSWRGSIAGRERDNGLWCHRTESFEVEAATTRLQTPSAGLFFAVNRISLGPIEDWTL